MRTEGLAAEAHDPRHAGTQFLCLASLPQVIEDNATATLQHGAGHPLFCLQPP